MPNKKILIVGGVAAGTKAAAKCRREDLGAEITVPKKQETPTWRPPAHCFMP